jgi:hypothetical protein
MSVSKVKELFYLATNAKMVLGGNENEQAEKLREALAISKSLNDELWPYIPAYRLAHLLFRKARSKSDFDEIISLLEHSEKSGSSYVSIHSSMLKFVALHRQKMLGVQGMTEKLRLCVDNIVSRIQELNRFEIATSVWNKPVQGDYFNVLEYLVYASDLEYDRLIGTGYDDRNTLFPGRNNDVWRIVGIGGEIDEFCYNYDTGFVELNRLIKENQPQYHFVFGNPRETFLENFSQERITNPNKVNLLLRLLIKSPYGEEVREFTKIWGAKEAAKDARQDLNKFLDGNLFQPHLRRWAIKPECEIYGLVNIDRLAEANRPIRSR